MKYKGKQLPPKARERLIQIVKEGYIRPTMEEELYYHTIRGFLEEWITENYPKTSALCDEDFTAYNCSILHDKLIEKKKELEEGK